ncbi:MAG: permease prefix domain 1-containing protein [Ruminococcus sp.]|nr:permease prefix domain 1-containing protein [Ruminococcus sp.]
MRDKIEAYIEELFWKAPNTPQTRDLKEEILGNTLEKYEDLLADGMDEDSAYRSAISGIGDVDELIKEYSEDSGELIKVESAVSKPDPMVSSYSEKKSIPDEVSEKYSKLRWTYVIVGIVLYFIGIIFPAEFEELEIGRIEIESFGVSVFLILAAIATGLIIYSTCFKKLIGFYGNPEKEDITKQRAKFLAVGVGLVITCLVPVSICSDLQDELRIDWLLSLGVIMMLVMLVAAVGPFICRAYIGKPIEIETYQKEKAESEKANNPATSAEKLVKIIMWCLILTIYIVISVITGAWTVTWVIFLIGAALTYVLDAIFEIYNSKK